MKFKRSDGVEFEAEEGSESYKLMLKDGRFECADEVAMEAAQNSSEPEKLEKPLAKMNKLELLAEAKKCGLELVPDEVTKAQIIAAIEGVDAKPAETEANDQIIAPTEEVDAKAAEPETNDQTLDRIVEADAKAAETKTEEPTKVTD